MQLHDLALAAIALVSEVVGTLSGFGSSTFFVPAALMLESVRLVLVLTSILHCFSNVSKIILFRHHFEKRVFLSLAIPSLVFTGLGAWLATIYSAFMIQRCLGVFLIVVGGVRLLKPRGFEMRSPLAALWLTAASGLATGYVGTGGALRGLAMSSLHLSKSTFVIVSAAIDLGSDCLRAYIYLTNGFMDWSHWFYIPLLAMAAYVGTKLGKRLLSRFNQRQFERIVATFVVISGVMLLLVQSH